jgi:predicted O-methyltransferase YrrM
VRLLDAIRRVGLGRVRDDPRLRALAVGAGVARPRRMHSDAEAALLRMLAHRRRRVVEIGVFEGSSALVLYDTLEPGAELHLVDPFRDQRGAAREHAAATEWATRRVVARAAKRAPGPRVVWHVDYSASVAENWTLPVDLVFIDGDHSEIGVAKDWDLWHPFVAEGGAVLFQDARASQPGGRGLPGPTAVVDRLFRGPRALPDWEISEEVGRAVAVVYAPRAA